MNKEGTNYLGHGILASTDRKFAPQRNCSLAISGTPILLNRNILGWKKYPGLHDHETDSGPKKSAGGII
jgi:hypothetical protein